MPRDKKRVASDSDSDSGPEDRGPAKKVTSSGYYPLRIFFSISKI